MVPEDVVDKYGEDMTPYEQKEIMQYPEVWYLGQISNRTERKIRCGPNNGKCSFAASICVYVDYYEIKIL